MGVQGLLVKIRIQLELFALDDDAQVVSGHPGDAFLGFDQLDGLADFFELALGQQPFGGVTRDVHARRALINGLLDLGIAAPRVQPDLGKPFHFAAVFPVGEKGRVFLHDPGVDGVDAVGLGQFECLADFRLRVVTAHEGRDVRQVARMRVAADQIAAEHEPAELLIADSARRHRPLRRGRGRAGSRGGDGG